MKKKILLSLALLLIVICQQKTYCQNSNATLTHETISLETDKIFDKLVKIRRAFHENPELAGEEIRTQEIIKHYLLDLGLEVETNIYGRSVVGILKGGKEGKKIAWRADMDALPNDFPDDVDFKSTIKGVQHGCGHDIHLAIALGIAEVLSKNKASLHGTVYFIFQPEEETFRGAKSMMDSGLLSKINPDEIYGFHITALPVGQIMVKPNELFAYQKRISIKLKNELTHDQAKALTKNIQSLLFRTQNGSKPWELQNMVDPHIGVMNPNTIFKDYLIIDEDFSIYDKNGELFLEAYLYETNAANLETIIPKVKALIEASNYKNQLLSIAFIQENPTVINDEELTNIAVKTLDSIYGNGFIVKDYGQVPFFNDDFAYFQQKIPGVYFLLGGSNFEHGIIAMNHAPNFKVDETCIKTGVKCFASLIVERLDNDFYNHKIPTKASNKILFEDKEITEKWLAEKHIPALGIGYIKDGKMAQISVFGNLEKGKSAPKNTIWNVASLTKPITAMLTLKLVNSGQWDLDEPLYKYWIDPDIANDPRAKKLTTRHVLSHQTGFPNWRWNNKSKKLAFDFDPGTKYQYSGEGMEYLKKALQKKFNKTLDQLAQELIFTPLNMRDSRLIWDKTMDSTHFATGHNKKVEPYPINKRTEPSAADDLLTTVEDYSKFVLHIINGADLKPELFKDLITHQVKTKNGKYFGLGLELYDFGNNEYGLTHGGADEGVRTIAFILPQRKEGLVIFTNSDIGGNAYEPIVNAFLKDMGKKILAIEMK